MQFLLYEGNGEYLETLGFYYGKLNTKYPEGIPFPLSHQGQDDQLMKTMFFKTSLAIALVKELKWYCHS